MLYFLIISKLRNISITEFEAELLKNRSITVTQQNFRKAVFKKRVKDNAGETSNKTSNLINYEYMTFPIKSIRITTKADAEEQKTSRRRVMLIEKLLNIKEIALHFAVCNTLNPLMNNS